MTTIVLGNEYPPVDATITAIMVRELIEGVMFCTTHIGAVLKNEVLTKEEKAKCLKVLIPSVLSGVSIGLLVSIAIGISLVYAVGDQSSTQFGVEVGEGVSRLIGAFFVTDLVFKIPKWFKISNYKKEAKESVQLLEDDAYGKRWEVGFSLFWNTLRESIEGGALTAIAVILSEPAQAALGNSVGVAIAATVGLSLFFGLGAKYISMKIFGALATFITHLLAVGLWTGAARAFEEVYALNNGLDEEEGSTGMIYNFEGTEYGESLSILSFLGFSYSMTNLTLAVWLLSFFLLTLMQIWHNYFGYNFLPQGVRKKKKELKKKMKRCCRCQRNAPTDETVAKPAKTIPEGDDSYVTAKNNTTPLVQPGNAGDKEEVPENTIVSI